MKRERTELPEIEPQPPTELVAHAVTDLRHELRRSLPSLLRRAVDSYRRFSAGPAPDDAKSFVAYQSGCRAAIMHVQLLLKLSAFVESETAAATGTEQADAELEELIETAKAALEGHAEWDV